MILLLLTTPADAHCYHIWHYPKPQKCFTALAPEQIRKRSSHPTIGVTGVTPERIMDLPLPALNWIECPPGDERMFGIAKLRALEDVSRER